MANIAQMEVTVRIFVSDTRVPLWRVRLLGRIARVLRVPLEFTPNVTLALANRRPWRTS